MKSKYIIPILIALLVITIIVVVADFSTTRMGNRSENKYEFDVDKYKQVDSSLIQFTETRRIKTGEEKPVAIDLSNNRLFLLSENNVKILDPETGNLLNKFETDTAPACIEVFRNFLIVGYKNYIEVRDLTGEMRHKSATETGNAFFTAISTNDEHIFVADAGNRRINVYSPSAEKQYDFEGHKEENERHGFIIPSPFFDLTINDYNELWIVNPGKHRLEQYTFDGRMTGYWEKTSINIEGFSGCCNPAHFDIMPNGTFVTSEKGMVRVKTYKPSGEFLGVVAEPAKFPDDSHKAPDIATENNETVVLLDYNTGLIQIFNKK